MDTAIFDLQSQVTFFSLCQCNRDAMNAASTHPVDMLERQEEIFIVACLKKKKDFDSRLCLHDTNVGVIREH